MAKRGARNRRRRETSAGVALILVMLCIVVLSVLAASIVFSARSEALASHNYRVSTQADYVAKAGLQKAINFFNSNKYVAVDPTNPTGTYSVSPYATTPVTLYNGTQRPVVCIANCATNNSAVVLQMNSSGTFNGNYPTNITNADGQTVPTAFASRFYNVSLDPTSASANSGQFTVTATLDEFFTVNDAFYPTINRKPYEVWHIVSTGTWNSVPPAGGATNVIPTSVQEATLAPVYLPFFANALYGMCNITMNGNVCTDSYNSRNGTYNGSNASNCVTSSGVASNAYASGAGIGSGGNVTLNGGSYVVNGDVSYGATPPSYSSLWACPSASSGVTGSVSGVHGAVQPVPAIPEPPMPTFPACSWYGGGGTSCNKNSASYPTPPDPANLGNGDYMWTKLTAGIWYDEVKVGGTTTDYPLTYAGWSATTGYAVGTIIAPGNGHAYTVTTAGTSGTTQPTWPTASSGTVSDGLTGSNWLSSHAYSVGTIVKPSPANGHLYKAISAGTSGLTQPAFPTGSGATINDPSPAVWAASTSYAVGANIGANGHMYTVSVGGISGASAPTWPTGSGATVTDANYATWNNKFNYSLGAVIVPSGGGNGHIYKCIVAGKSGNSAPTWPTGSGATVVDGTATWQEAGSSSGITWTEAGTISAVTWQEIGLDNPVVWTEAGSMTNIFGAGTASDPFRLPAVSSGNNANVCLTGGATPDAAIYYDIKDFYSHGTTYIVNVANQPTTCPPAGYSDFGYAVLNIYQTMDLGGQGIVQPNTASASSLMINVYNSGNNSGTSLRMTGQANIKAVITALGDATLGGSGSGGAFYGSLLAGSITDAGTYPVHYDQSLQVLSGKLTPMAIRNYNRPKF